MRVNRTAEEASVADAATDPAYTLELVNGDLRTTLTRPTSRAWPSAPRCSRSPASRGGRQRYLERRPGPRRPGAAEAPTDRTSG